MDYFKPEKYLEDAVKNGDVQQIRIAICLYIDKDIGDFNNEMSKVIDYINNQNSNIPNIWEEHIEIEKLKPQEEWDIDYIGLLQSDLMHNFSIERLNTILNVGEYVYGRGSIKSDNKYVNEDVRDQCSTKKIDNLPTKNNEIKSPKMIYDNKYTKKCDKYNNKDNQTSKKHNSKDSNNATYDERSNGMKTQYYEKINQMKTQNDEKKLNVSVLPLKNNHRININNIGRYGIKIIKYGTSIVICGVEFLVNIISKKTNK